MWRTCGLALGLLATVVGQAAAQEKEIDRWALLVGIDDYAQLADLSCAAADQRAFAKRLEACGFPRDHVFLLESKSAEAKYLPSKLNIEKQLDLVLKVAAQGDVVVIGFSGHGVQIDGASFLCPMEARWSEPDSMIALDAIYKRLQGCRADLKLALVDACREQDPRLVKSRAIGAARGVTGVGTGAERPPRGVMMLTSCDFGQLAWEDERVLGHGVFMHFVLEGLRGLADRDTKGAVSVQELSRFAAERTKTYVVRKFNEVQEPTLRGEVALEVLDYPLAVVNEEDAAANSVGMRLVTIPPGEFTMGTPLERDRGFTDETQHRVRLTRGFDMGMHEVTVGQFRQFVEATKYRTEAEADGMGASGWIGEEGQPFEVRPDFNWRNWWANQSDECPVVGVSWNDAVAFCQWLSQREGANYRLPTDAEWEYACRAGSSLQYVQGDTEDGLKDFSNVFDAGTKQLLPESEVADYAKAWDDGYPMTAPVGSFKPNAFGLHDMLGNVHELCQDWYTSEMPGAGLTVDPVGPADGQRRVLRGGSWYGWPINCRYGRRDHIAPSTRFHDTGFRVVRER